jgi:hypothetical protein
MWGKRPAEQGAAPAPCGRSASCCPREPPGGSPRRLAAAPAAAWRLAAFAAPGALMRALPSISLELLIARGWLSGRSAASDMA